MMFPAPMLLLLSASSFVVAAAAEGLSPEVESALSRAVAFIQSSRDPTTLMWWPAETPSAILGLASGDPVWRRDKDSQGYKLAVAGLDMAVLDAMARSNGSLSAAFDDSTFAQVLSALQVTCGSPRSFRGGGVADLLSEGLRRLRAASRRSPALAGLALPLCNGGVRLGRRQIGRLRFPRRRGDGARGACRSLCVEKASLNVLALTCVFKHRDAYDREDLNLANQVLHENVRYLRGHPASQPAHPGRNLFETSMLLQAAQGSPVDMDPLDPAALTSELLSFQSPDGSFGGSVSLTAMAIPALSKFNGLDIPGVEAECKRRIQEEEKTAAAEAGSVMYEIRDDLFNAQTLIGDFHLGGGGGGRSSVLDLLEEFQDRHPAAIQFEVKDTAFGPKLRSLLGIRESRAVSWNVYRIQGRKTGEGDREERVRDLRRAVLEDGDTVVFRYQRN